MYFEATYLPSPQFSTESLDDSLVPDMLSPTEEALPPPQAVKEDQRHEEEEKEEEVSEETPVNHLVFVIHGIGQQTEQYGHFYEHVESLQETTRQVLQAKVPDHNVRIELIPIEWHRHIHDQVDPILNKITLKSIPTIRLIENDYLADVLFYFSKSRGQSIIDNVTRLFNTSYHNFMEKHPDFDGKIVILGYSLGGILTWDILSHQREPSSEEERLDYNKLDVIYQKLDFKPNYLFTLGSPIGAVLTFRNQSPVTYHPDYDIVFENVFHPFDPLAYRIEPLYDEYYTDQPAVLVDRSAPLGPSFSFPSLPSLPGLGLFSFFSWKMSSSSNDNGNVESNAANNDTTNNAIEASFNIKDNDITTSSNGNHSSGSDSGSVQGSRRNTATASTTSTTSLTGTNMDGDEQQQGKSIMNSLLQYFSKGRRGSKDSHNNLQSASESKTNSAAASTISDTYEHDHTHLEQQSNRDSPHGIITWDPLHEQRRSTLSGDDTSQTSLWQNELAGQDGASNNNMKDTKDGALLTNSTSTSTDTTTSSGRRPLNLQRAKTYCAQGVMSGSVGDAKEPVFFYEIDKAAFTSTTTDNGEGSYDIMEGLPGTNGSLSNSNNNTYHPNNDNSSNTNNGEKPHTELRHLVEVLGIDGVRMESFERAKANFPGNKTNSDKTKENPIEQEEYRSLDTTNDMDKHKNGPIGKAKEVIQEGVTAYTTTPENITNKTTIETDQDVNRRDEEEEEKQQQPTSEPTMGNEDGAQAKEEARIQQQALDHLPGKRRIDFALQPDGFMSMIANEYIVGLRAHFSYWTSKDLIWHILQTLEK